MMRLTNFVYFSENRSGRQSPSRQAGSQPQKPSSQTVLRPTALSMYMAEIITLITYQEGSQAAPGVVSDRNVLESTEERISRLTRVLYSKRRELVVRLWSSYLIYEGSGTEVDVQAFEAVMRFSPGKRDGKWDI